MTRLDPPAGGRNEVGQHVGGRFSTAVVLFHAAVAERVGLNVTDLKCAEIISRRGPIYPSQLAAITGMSSAAVAQVLGRLERSDLIRREPDPTDRRRTVVRALPSGAAQQELGRVFGELARRVASITDRYRDDEREVITEFVTAMTEVLEAEAIALRSRARG